MVEKVAILICPDLWDNNAVRNRVEKQQKWSLRLHGASTGRKKTRLKTGRKYNGLAWFLVWVGRSHINVYLENKNKKKMLLYYYDKQKKKEQGWVCMVFFSWVSNLDPMQSISGVWRMVIPYVVLLMPIKFVLFHTEWLHIICAELWIAVLVRARCSKSERRKLERRGKLECWKNIQHFDVLFFM